MRKRSVVIESISLYKNAKAASATSELFAASAYTRRSLKWFMMSLVNPSVNTPQSTAFRCFGTRGANIGRLYPVMSTLHSGNRSCNKKVKSSRMSAHSVPLASSCNESRRTRQGYSSRKPTTNNHQIIQTRIYDRSGLSTPSVIDAVHNQLLSDVLEQLVRIQQHGQAKVATTRPSL